LGKLFNELKRRNVFRVAVAYLVAAWLVLQVSQLVLEAIDAPSWVIQVFLLIFGVGLPFALLFSWAYELTPEGVKREKEVDRTKSVTHHTGKKLDQITIGMVIALVIFIAADRTFFSQRIAPAADPEITQTAIEDKSLAVLAFEDLSQERDQAYFADGLSEELLNVLSQVPDLKVAGRTSSFAFKGKDIDLREIGEILNVAHILEGSVRKSGNRIRVTAQLINATDGFHLYSESFDRDLTDIFEVQDEIAGKISSALQSELIGTASVHEVTPTQIEAYDLYLIARQKIYTRDKTEMEDASRLLDQALAIDPDYVPALAQKALAVYLLSDHTGAYGDIPIAEALAVSRPMVNRAIELDPKLAEAHAVSGLMMAAETGYSLEKAIATLEHALALNPNLDNARNWLASAYFDAGRDSEATALYESVVERDPLYGPAFNNLTQSYVFTFDFDKANALIGRVERITGENENTNQAWGTVAFVQGELARAVRHYRRAYEVNPSASVVRLWYGMTLERLGDYETILEVGLPPFQATALTALKRYEEAEALLKRLSPLLPVDAVISRAAYYYVDRHMYDELIAYVEQHFGSVDALIEHFDTPDGLQASFAAPLAYTYLQSGDEAAFRKLTDFLAGMIEKRRPRNPENFPIWFDQADLAAVTGMDDVVFENVNKMIDHGGSGVGFFDNPMYAPLLEQERFRAQEKILTDRTNAERAKLGLEPFQAPLAAMD
jgi:TolB-like protein/Flp pilus assembly protein TadD